MIRFINIRDFYHAGTKVLSGRVEGMNVRERLELDEFDKSCNILYIKIPDYFYYMTLAFFLGLFGDSIRTLGKEQFKSKYKINCNNYYINEQIQEGINYAMKK